jgi:hypothetical protein
MAEAIRDGNRITVALGQSNADATVTLPFKIDSVTGRLLVATTGSSSVSILVATGTVDDSNVTFTFASTPHIVVVNGMSYVNGHGVTIVTTTATLDSPAGTGGYIYGIS